MFLHGACYIRVSTDDQSEYSPDAQLRLLKDYAKKNNIILNETHIYRDEGISGRKADKRPAFMKMIATAKTKPKPFDVILVHKFDRFARSREDSVVYKSLLKKEAGIKVVSITESIEDDKFSIILEAMLEAMAEYYSLNLSEEVKKGMTEKANRGELQSTPPFGYKAEGGQLVIVPEEARMVRFIFEQFVSHQKTMRHLAVYMNDLGVKSHRHNKFEVRSIEYILNNPVYIGKLRWTPTERARRNYTHPDTIICDSTHEPAIGIELWEKAQEALKQNKQLYKPRIKKDAPLRTWLKGLVKCGMCGKTLTGCKNGYFQCNGYSNGTCRLSSSISIKKLESIVLNELQNTFDDELEITVAPQANNADTANEYNFLTEKLKKLDFREERIKIAFQDGIDTPDEYKANKKALAEEWQATVKKLDGLKRQLASVNIDDGIYKRIDSVYALLTDTSIKQDIKYKTAHFLISNIIFTKQINELVIEFRR